MSDMSLAAMQAEIERLRADLAAAKARKPGAASLKVSDKGALSVYGLQRFPVTLYKSQWLRLLAMAGEIKGFIEANQDALVDKPTS